MARSRSTAGDAYVARRLAEGHAALARAAWDEARTAFEAALAAGESPEALEGLGMAAWWLDDGRQTIDARERAYRLYRASGDRVAAGRLAAELAEDHVYFLGRPAAARGWLQRARRLLDGLDLRPEHGWLRIIEGDLSLSITREPERAQSLAQEAASIGRALSEIDIELLALALEGLSLVMQGRVAEGLPQLDEVATAALAGEMADPVAVGFVCCYVVTGCARARDVGRATEWTQKVQEFSERTRFRTLTSVCRVEYAAVLIWRGEWPQADQALTGAAAQLEAAHPAFLAEAFVRLAELRRRQGQLDEAAELLTRAEGSSRVLLERAALALERGKPDAAALAVERFLRQTPASQPTDRVEGLDVWLRAAVALGDRRCAARLLSEIHELTAGASTEPLRAAARLAEGIGARAAGDLEGARRAFEDAVDLFGRCGAVVEQARARLELAQVVAALGLHESANVEARAAAAVFQRVGASRAVQRATELLRSLRTPAAAPRPGDLTIREVEVLNLVAQGLHNHTIARRLCISEHTVKRHVANILTKLDLPSRAAAAAFAARHGLH